MQPPTAASGPRTAIALVDALHDRDILTEYFDALAIKSYKSLKLRAQHIRQAAAFAGADDDVIDWIFELTNAHAKRRLGHTSRGDALARQAAWFELARRHLTWDQAEHRRHRPRTKPEARSLRTRAVMWVEVTCGLRVENLAAMTAEGPRPHLTRDAQGVMDVLAFEKAETKNKNSVTIPLADGARHLLTAYYDRACPLLVSRLTPANAPVFLTDQGRPFKTCTLAWMLSAHLRGEIFGGIPVYPHFLRSLCVNLLIDGFRFEPTVVAGVIGDTVDVTMNTYRRLNPQVAVAEYRAVLRRQPRDAAVDRLMADLNAWLERLAADFSG